MFFSQGQYHIEGIDLFFGLHPSKKPFDKPFFALYIIELVIYKGFFELYNLKKPLYNLKKPLYNLKKPLYNLKKPLYNLKKPLYNLKKPLYNLKKPLYNLKKTGFVRKKPLKYLRGEKMSSNK